jgi:hypothetical protein
MGWIISLAWLVCYIIGDFREPVMLIASALFAIAGSITTVAVKLDKK